MKVCLPLLLIFTLSAEAGSMRLKCEARHDSDVLVNKTVNLRAGERNKVFADGENYQFLLTEESGGIVEVEAYHRFDSMRSYAKSKLTERGAFAELTIWKRDYLLQVRCTRI